jgi:hypothetical protein
MWLEFMNNAERLSLGLMVLAILLVPSVTIGSTYIVFRYDDFAADQQGVREKNSLRKRVWEAEQNIDALFKKYDMSYVVAIIPNANLEYGRAGSEGGIVSFSVDREKIEFIKRAVQAGRVEVAQHGFSHTNVVGSNHRPGEFRERDYESQLRDISHGREMLLRACELSDMSTFVPPWNAWTDDTARILGKLGFKILSADRYYCYGSVRGLTIIPYTAVPQELELMVDQKLLPGEGIIVVCYHPFEIARFPGRLGRYYFGVGRFEKLLQTLSTMPNVELGTFIQLAEKCEDLTVERYKQANSMWRQRAFWAKILPESLWPGTRNQYVYLGLDEYSQRLRYWKAATIGLIAGLLMIGLLVRYLLSLVLSFKWCFRVDVLATLLFFFALLAELHLMWRGYHMTAVRAIPLFLGGSFVVALMSRTLKRARQLVRL